MRYRITKYDPQFRNNTGAYMRDDWTSCSDIGRIYEGKTLSKNQYMQTEEAYCQAIRQIISYFKIDHFVLAKFEQPFSVKEIMEDMSAIGIDATECEVSKCFSLYKKERLTQAEALLFAKWTLREAVWGQLDDICGRVSIEFGYDYYLYVTCSTLPSQVIGRIESVGLFVEAFEE